MLNISNIDFQRQRFEKVNRFYGAKGIAPQLSLIRIEENLVNGQNMYEFDLKKENTTKVENNLKRNDLFVCLGISVALRIEDNNHPYVNLPKFYPNLGQLDNGTVVVEGFKTNDIKALYNGSLYIATGTTVNFADMPMSLFLRNGETSIDSNGTNIQKVDKYNLRDNIEMMAEELIFSGTQDHKIQVTFPNYALADYQAMQDIESIPTEGEPIYATNRQSKIVFMALGYRVVGGTLPSYRVDENPYKDCI